MTSPRLSVVIATYSRASLLNECLRHLASQRFQDGDEVIVVDNGSVDDTAGIVRTHQVTFPTTLHLLTELQPGKSHALARALAVAQGEVVAFLDDDVNVGVGWLDVVRDTMVDTSVALMGGRVEPRWDGRVPLWMRHAPFRYRRLGAPLGLLDYPSDVVELGPRTVLGANMAVRRDVFEAVGGFATHLGKLRGTLLSGEDHELCLRVQRAGFKAIYVPRAVVHHWVPLERARAGYFLQWFYWSGITNAILEAQPTATPPAIVGDWAAHRGPDSRPANASGVAKGVPMYLVKRALVGALMVLASLAAGRRTTALNHAIDVAFAAGFAAERWGFASRHLVPAEQISPEAA
jgi:GT2 family glycosyltransferase